MKASAIKPHHLLVSVQSLQSICTKKNSGTDLIDNAALTQLTGQVRTELRAYNEVHDIPELKIILNRFPEPRSYERGSSIQKAIIRITIWGTLAMGLTALVGYLFGVNL
jgi:hypothetical protein